LKPAEIELGAVAVVGLDVMDDLGQAHEPDSKAPLAKRLAPELMSSQPTPTAIVVGAASGVTTLAATSGMKADEGIGAHRGTLIRPRGTRNWSTLSTPGEDDPAPGISGGGVHVHRKKPYPYTHTQLSISIHFVSISIHFEDKVCTVHSRS
jgi:hypothetical protein